MAQGRGQARCDYGRWLIVLRDLAMWMSNQRQNKFKGKLSDERERKLNSIRFMWDRWEHEWHAMFCAVKRFKDKDKREEVAETWQCGWMIKRRERGLRQS